MGGGDRTISGALQATAEKAGVVVVVSALGTAPARAACTKSSGGRVAQELVSRSCFSSGEGSA
jgi:hypothetical protein